MARKREARKRDEREAAAAAVRAGRPRRQPSAQEAAALAAAVEKNQASHFGLKRLSTIELDRPLPAPPQVAAGDAQAAPASQHQQQVHQCTLLGLAVCRRRDAIVLALLRAGANPAGENRQPFRRLQS